MVSSLRAAVMAAAGLLLAAASSPGTFDREAIGSTDQAVIQMASLDTSYSLVLDGGQPSPSRDRDEALDTSFSTVLDDQQPQSAPAVVETPATLAALVDSFVAADAPIDDELRCLATAVFFESKGEPLKGQLAVAQVVLNRVSSNRFADSICGVVYQPRQFSFANAGHVQPRMSRDWRTAVAIARIAMDNKWADVSSDALFFHATYVAPKWSGRHQKVSLIGRHVFYR